MKRQHPENPDLIGKKFGKLTVVKINPWRNGFSAICDCDCGKKNIKVIGHKLLSGHTKSCGCLIKDIAAHRRFIKDLSGMKFNKLTVIKDSGKRKNKNVVWLCLCDCGNYTEVTGSKLQRGHTKSCGCYQNEIRKKSGLLMKDNLTSEGGPLIHDLTGLKFGRLTVLKIAKRNNQKDSTKWLCKCECGKKTIVNSYSLRKGRVLSCGCYHSDLHRICPKEDMVLPPTKRYAKNLTDGYIKAILCAHNSGIKNENISNKMITLKRQQLTMYRTLKQFKQWRKENEPNHTNVYGEQQPDEKNNERGISIKSSSGSTAGI